MRTRASRRHIATYIQYAEIPGGGFDTKQKVGTRYIMDAAELARVQEECARTGHPLELRWRNRKEREAHEGTAGDHAATGYARVSTNLGKF
jgi:hypothetical protein